ncbi:MAG: DUF3298 and DUF4163 domain-containing protein [Clostridia bacterium]|nr:DUF3298 and DUF4163 domain-containing protein [Clostridia bacterium]
MKKAVSLIILAAFMAFCLASCSGGTNSAKKEETPDVSEASSGLLSLTAEKFSFVEWSSEYFTTLALCEYSLPALSDECAAEYPALSEALSAQNEQSKAGMKSEYESMIEGAKDEAEYAGEYFSRFELKSDFTVRRADSTVLSLLYNTYMFSGGAHGMYSFYGRTYDSQTGRELALSDVVTDMSALPAVVAAQIEKYCGDVEFYEGLDIEEYVEQNADTIFWTLEYDALTLYFNPYEIAPYAYGVQIVPIPFAEYPDLIADEYKTVPEAYGVQLLSYTHSFYDTDGDGDMDRICVSGVTNEYGSFENVTITLDDENFTEDYESYSEQPMLMHTDSGNTYLYIFGQDLDGFPMLTVFDISAGTIKKVGEAPYGMHSVYTGAEPDDEEVYRAKLEIPTDPNSFRLDAAVRDITVDRGWDVFAADENGMPSAENGFFTIEYPTIYRVFAELDTTVLDANGAETDEILTLEPGDVVTRIRTDDATYSDFLLADGETVVRASFTIGDDGNSFGGLPSDEVFALYWGGYGEDPGFWDPVVMQRQVLLDEDYPCGVVFIGYVDRAANDLDEYREYYNTIFEGSGYAEDFDFLTSVPANRFVCVEQGEELYLVIPRDENASVTVSAWYIGEENDYQGEAKEILYKSEDGAPFLLKCNVSEIMPDTLITVVDGAGEILEWSPAISLMDGHVSTVSNLKYVYDFTRYDE